MSNLNLYGLTCKTPGVSESEHRFMLEMQAIKLGGSWSRNGKQFGLGLPAHFKNAAQIIWPGIDWHRWNELANDEIRRPNAKVTVFMGAGSTGKTATAAWEYLLEYYCNPNETLVLVSSTDMRGLELRVWGEIKMLHDRALTLFPWLPGHLIDSKHCIATDDIDESEFDDKKIRDIRKGIIGIPCIQNGKFIGLGKYAGIKQKHMRLVGDECFPAGTMVATPTGKRPIETIKAGDYILNCLGFSKVVRSGNRIATDLVKITAKDGREIICTQEHPIFTNEGWKKAIDLRQGQYMIAVYESMQILRDGNEKQNFLFDELQREVGDNIAGRSGEILYQRARTKNINFKGSDAPQQSSTCGEFETAAVGKQLHEEHCNEGKGFGNTESRRVEADHSRWKRNRNNSIRKNSDELVCGCEVELSSENWKEKRERLSNELQGGRGFGWKKTGYRIGRFIARLAGSSGAGCEENPPVGGSWVDSVEILKPESFIEPASSKRGIKVYNLEVAGHPSYSVNGFLVHNCQFMGASFLSAFTNLNNNVDFQAILLGNPNDQLDPLGMAAEPKLGWGDYLEPEKTLAWDTKFFSGRCINFVGTDSPNFDYPDDLKARYPYLISEKKIAEAMSFYGKDTVEYYSQCKGVMKVGQMAKRVLSRDLCRQFHAQDDCIWDGEVKKIAALDASYGGDRCVFNHADYGKCVDGKIRLKVYDPEIVPIKVKTERPMDAEEQIAAWVKNRCEVLGILPENFFHDSTGRGSLGTALARVWSPSCNPVEFGGSPTKRIVSADMMVTELPSGNRRPKRCEEHYSKFVTELWFAVRYAVEADQMRGMTTDVIDEFCMREWKRVNNDKLEVESKIDMKSRTRRSPDLADCCAIIVEGARRKGFTISKLGELAKSVDTKNDWLSKRTTEWQDLLKKRQLQNS